MNELKVFRNEEFGAVRTLTIEGTLQEANLVDGFVIVKES